MGSLVGWPRVSKAHGMAWFCEGLGFPQSQEPGPTQHLCCIVGCAFSSPRLLGLQGCGREVGADKVMGGRGRTLVGFYWAAELLLLQKPREISFFLLVRLVFCCLFCIFQDLFFKEVPFVYTTYVSCVQNYTFTF